MTSPLPSQAINSGANLDDTEYKTEAGESDSDFDDFYFDKHDKPMNKNTESPKWVTEFIFMFAFYITKWQLMFNISSRAVNCLLKMIYVIMYVLALQTRAGLETLLEVFPNSLYKLQQVLNFDDDQFEKYILCPNPECAMLYSYNDVVHETASGIKTAKVCKHQMYNSGPCAVACNTKLVKRVKLKGGIDFVPIKTFCYDSVTNNLEQILSKPGFYQKCQEWKSRDVPNDLYADIYDGIVWKQFGMVNGVCFFNQSDGHIGLQFKIDWLQPFDRRSDVSIGVIYMTVLNLPREIRYKRENCIVVGIIPNMDKEPNLEHILGPLVKELQLLWEGVKLKTSMHSHGKYVRAALVNVACDVPATRKVLGFMTCNSRHGCSKCKKEFPGNVKEGMDFSGNDCEMWCKRSTNEHRRVGRELKHGSLSKTGVHKHQSQTGYKYSPLLELKYFDSIRFHVIDPMHNLFSGTGKRMWRHWSQQLKCFSQTDIDIINDRLERMSAVSDNGWVPKNIGSNWGAWTAYEWKAWVLVYSSYCLEGVLDDDDMKVWLLFVEACKLIVKPSVTKSDVNNGHALLKSFVGNAERLYGKKFITPNMHLHLHLKETMFDFGPVHSYWLFFL